MKKTVYLLDKNTISEIPKLKVKENDKIYSFDFETHSILSSFNFKHEIMENIIDKKFQILIEDKALEISLNWYRNQNIAKVLQYDKINLGWLLETEIYQYLIQIIKNFVGLLFVLKKENPQIIFMSQNFADLVNTIREKNFEVKILSKSTHSKFYFDDVEIPLNLGAKKFTLSTSRNSALKLKQIIEFSTNTLFDLKFDPKNSDKKQILLLEFNPLLYTNFLSNLSSDFQLLLLNERRPAVWNKKTLDIVKTTNSKILNLKNFKQNIEKLIIDKKKIFEENFQKFENDSESLMNIFKIIDHSFWNAIKENFFQLCLNRFLESIERIELSNAFFSKTKLHCILSMYNTGFEERSILSVASSYKIPEILLQHGFYAENPYMKKFYPILGFLPILEQKEAIWGNSTFQTFLKEGIRKDNLILSGSLRHEKYFNSKPYHNDGILLATNIIMPIDFMGFHTQTHIDYEYGLSEIVKIITKIPNKKSTVKLHPAKSPLDQTEKIIRNSSSKIEVIKTGDIFNLMQNCELLISTEHSTVLLEAMILKKPTITFLFDPKEMKNEEIISSGATAYVKSIDEFKIILEKILYDENYRTKLIQNGTQFVDNYFSHKISSNTYLSDYIKKI